MHIQSESVAQGNCMNWNLRLGYTVQLYITCIYGQKYLFLLEWNKIKLNILSIPNIEYT